MSARNHPLDGDVDVRHQVDGALLVDLESAAERGKLNGAGAPDCVDRRGEVGL